MYPANYFALFPPFPRLNNVFVAMSFDPRFDVRWQQVIKPAICGLGINGNPLQDHRVDTRRVSDSILTEILGGIRNDRLIFADVTSMGQIDGQAVRSGNVMYEVGLSQAVRLPEEVLLFRSDRDHLLFDVANVRVNQYDPESQPERAREQVTATIMEAVKEVDLRKHLAVKATAESLDYTSWLVLAEASGADGIAPPQNRTMGQALGNSVRFAAIARLLEFGALATVYITVTPDMLESSCEAILKYKVTPFGKAILQFVADRMGVFSPELQPLLEAWAKRESAE